MNDTIRTLLATLLVLVAVLAGGWGALVYIEAGETPMVHRLAIVSLGAFILSWWCHRE